MLLLFIELIEIQLARASPRTGAERAALFSCTPKQILVLAGEAT